MQSLKVMLLAGGPDKERPVSLMAAEQVAAALREAGHQVQQHDIGPDNLSALDRFAAWPGDVVFPLLHGPWGEGGELQQHLDHRDIPYVGAKAAAARRCIDKYQTKQIFDQQKLPTPAYELLSRGKHPKIVPPVVVKALCEGSSFDLKICHDDKQLAEGLEILFARHEQLLLEQYIPGKELTVGILDSALYLRLRLSLALRFMITKPSTHATTRSIYLILIYLQLFLMMLGKWPCARIVHWVVVI